MSQLLMLSFDEFDSVADLTYLHPVNAQSWLVLSTTTPHGVGKSIQCTNGGGYVMLQIPGQAGKTLNFGFPYQTGQYGTILSLHSSVVPSRAQQITLYLNTSNYLELRRGSTILATGTTLISLNTFNTFQVTALIANSGGQFAVYVNGNPLADINYTGDTQNQATNEVSMLCFGHDNVQNGSADWYLHHLVMFDTLGTKNNGLVPATIKKAHMHPISDGASIWTPSAGANVYSLIDELIGAPNDTDYAKSSTLNAKNRCVVDPAPSNVGTVVAIQEYSRFKKLNVGTIAVKSSIIAGANEPMSAERYLPASAVDYLDTFEYKTGTTEFTAADVTGGTLEVAATVTAVG